MVAASLCVHSTAFSVDMVATYIMSSSLGTSAPVNDRIPLTILMQGMCIHHGYTSFPHDVQPWCRLRANNSKHHGFVGKYGANRSAKTKIHKFKCYHMCISQVTHPGKKHWVTDLPDMAFGNELWLEHTEKRNYMEVVYSFLSTK